MYSWLLQLQAKLLSPTRSPRWEKVLDCDSQLGKRPAAGRFLRVLSWQTVTKLSRLAVRGPHLMRPTFDTPVTNSVTVKSVTLTHVRAGGRGGTSPSRRPSSMSLPTVVPIKVAHHPGCYGPEAAAYPDGDPVALMERALRGDGELSRYCRENGWNGDWTPLERSRSVLNSQWRGLSSTDLPVEPLATPRQKKKAKPSEPLRGAAPPLNHQRWRRGADAPLDPSERWKPQALVGGGTPSPALGVALGESSLPRRRALFGGTWAAASTTISPREQCRTDEAGVPAGGAGLPAGGMPPIGHGASPRPPPAEVTRLREETNAASLPCYPVANGHAILMECGGLGVVDALSPAEEGAGTLHWDSYMPYVPDTEWAQYAQGRDRFAAGSFTGDEDTVAGDRSSEYDGVRIFSRLEGLGLPNPGATDEGAPGRLFRTE